MVSCKNLSKNYLQGDVVVEALRNVSIDIQSGEFLSLYGPSGSGKTTLLNLIGGLDVPSSGSVTIEGHDISEMSAGERATFRLNNLGFIFQSYNLIPVLSAEENVEFVMQLQGVSASERRERSHEILAQLGLKGMEKRRPAELSGGQQQRVAIARAIVSKPKIILADEPTANLDSHTAESLLESMREMNKLHNATFIFSTHDNLVMSYAKRLVQLRDGEIVSDEVK